jgi:hypothetical protein
MSEFDDLFPPKPGGMVATARAKASADADQLASLNGAATASDTPYTAIRVRPEAPDAGTARTVTLASANPVAQLLPRDPTRRVAVVVAIDADVWISYNQGAAEDLSGTTGAGSAFYLPAGVPIPVDSRAQLWVSPTTTATSTRVSVLASRDSTL